jgi:diaminopimelate epimerase
VRFSKWHALGNSYLVVERADSGVLTPDRVRLLCDVDRGIGSDGVLEIVASDGVSAKIVIWNPDGSTAEMSGNGTRIAARWLAACTGESEVVIQVGARNVRARMIDEIDVATDIGEVEVGAIESIDLSGETVELTPVSVGNPHAVVRCDEPTRELLLRLGPLIETHPRFPERTNVQLVHPTSRHEIAALVWERGAGETAASGSSATAVAAAAIANGWCESPVTVQMPGGDLVVRFADNHAVLVGPAVEICAGMMTQAGDEYRCSRQRSDSIRLKPR